MIAGTTTVGATATLITTAGQYTQILLQNISSTAVVLGPSTVTATGAKAGVSLPANMTSPVLIPIGPTEKIFGIVASGSTTVAYLVP